LERCDTNIKFAPQILENIPNIEFH